MNALNITHPSIHSEFHKGNFVVQRSTHPFSSMAMDQSHEQLNKSIKGEGGAVGLTEDPVALRRWMIAGPELSRVVTEFEDTLCDVSPSSNKHHEQVPHVQTTFAKDIKSLVVTFEELGNPFLEYSKELVVLDTKIIMHDKAVQSVMSAKQLGIEQYHAFVADRIISNNNAAITDTLSKNSLPLFHSHVQNENSKSHSKAITLKRDCPLFSRLYIACQSREADLEQFFMHENQSKPPSISSQGRIRLGTKSDLLCSLEKLSTSISGDIFPDVSAHIIDGAAVVNMRKPKVAKTFGEYVDMDLMPYFMSRLEHVSRLDIVWDQYFSNSLKEYTRKVRGEGTRRRVLENTAIPKNWAGFLRNSDNKKELFCFLAEKISKLNSGSKEVYTTHLNDVLTAHEYDDSINEIKPCSHEEADTRMFLHVAHAAKHGHQKVSIRTVDTDVVVLAVAQIQHLQISELWIEFGIGKHYRFIPAHLVALSMGPKRASALPFFHALTGCDTTSAFCGIGKKTAWDAWEIFPQVTTVFSSLSKNLCEIDHSLLDKLEHFVVLLYSKTCEAERVNEARQELFARGRSVENIPPHKEH